MGRGVFACSGPADGDVVALRGTYAAPSGPDWGWRIDLIPTAATLRVVMHNVFPAEMGGQEAIAVEAEYSRA
jgi:hypothetical protein